MVNICRMNAEGKGEGDDTGEEGLGRGGRKRPQREVARGQGQEKAQEQGRGVRKEDPLGGPGRERGLGAICQS